MIDKLIENSPALAAIVLIVWAFLQAQAKRDVSFLDAMKARDEVFANVLKENNIVIANISKEVQVSSELLSAHNAEMRVTAAGILRAQKSRRKTK